jgi:membrane protease subunit HflK
MDWEKWQQRQRPPVQPPDLDKVVEGFRRMRGRMPRLWLLIIIAALVWLASGIFIVGPREAGVVKRFGAFARTVDPGPHYHLPFPIETVVKPEITKVQRIEIGFQTMSSPGASAQYRPIPDESLMLTGDENIVDVQFSVQFKILDPEDYLFNLVDPIKTIRDASEAAMREVVGRNKIDEVLTGGKLTIQNDTAELLQRILDSYKSGLRVEVVQLQEVHPPQEVRAAFRDVASAREDQNRFINEAEGYANDILPRSKGEAEALIRGAEAYREEKIQRAMGDASRFSSVLTEYDKAKEVTRQRLYLETMETVLSKARKFVMPSDGPGALPLLPLDGFNQAAEGTPSKEVK